jgi:hypothetical protein
MTMQVEELEGETQEHTYPKMGRRRHESITSLTESETTRC